MFKKLLIIAFVILFTLSGKAQGFKAGAIAGAVFSQFEGDTYGGFNKIGIVGGLYVNRWFNDVWAAQFEIVYKQKGSRHSPNESKNDYTLYKLNLNYMEVPLLAKLKVNDFMFEAGGAFGVLIHSSEENEDGTLNFTYPFEDYEMSGIVGINYNFHPRMLVNLRWSYGFTRARRGVYDIQPRPQWVNLKIGEYNHSVSLSVYYEFGRMFVN